MEFTCADFSKLSLNQVSDVLLERLHEEGTVCSKALLKGKDQQGNAYNLIVFLEVTNDE